MAKKTKTIQGKFLGSTYKRSIAKHKTQENALKDILSKNANERPNNIELTETTEKSFVFQAKTKL